MNNPRPNRIKYILNPHVFDMLTDRHGTQQNCEKELGLSHGTISKWRHGTASPEGDHLKALIALTGYPEAGIRLPATEDPKNAPQAPYSPSEGHTRIPLAIINDSTLTWEQRAAYTKHLSLPATRKNDFPAFRELPYHPSIKPIKKNTLYKKLDHTKYKKNPTITIPNEIINSTTLDLESIGMLIYLIANPPTNEGKIREKLVEASPAAYKVVNRISQKLIAAGEIIEHRTRNANSANRFGSLVWEIVRSTQEG
jgi:transcriptional regulator with XRE-family HTH domain